MKVIATSVSLEIDGNIIKDVDWLWPVDDA